MRITRLKPLALVLVLFACLSAVAQKNELGVLVGGYIPIGDSLNFSPGISLEGVVAHRIASVPFLAAYVELPVIAGFSLSAANSVSSANYSSLFITPGLKLKLAPSFPVSPYVAGGIGYARFHGTSAAGDTTASRAVVDIGGGVDWKILPYISIRGEVRDFHNSNFSLFNLSGVAGHNLIAAAGLVLRL